MWEGPDDKGAGAIMSSRSAVRWNRKQCGAHRAVAQTWKV
jgi:hypothetical protein